MAIDYAAAGAALRAGAKDVDLTEVQVKLDAIATAIDEVGAPDLTGLESAIANVDEKVATHSANFDAFVGGIINADA